MDYSSDGFASDVQQGFRLGHWLVQPRLHRIQGDTKTTKVEPKVMEVLLCLARTPGEVVTRDHLLDTVWAGTVVTDDVLTRSISELRKAFDDSPRAPSYIETIPKRGYRLIAPLTVDYTGDSAPPDLPTIALSPSMVPSRPAPVMERRVMIWTVVAGILLISAAILLLWRLNTTDIPPHVVWQPVPLTTYPGPERPPVFSPDGNQIAFAWMGSEGDNWDIYVKLVNSEMPLRLTEDPSFESNPAWSPNGSQIAYMRRSDEGCSIYLVAALGGPSRRLDTCGNNIYGDLTWSPDGQWLAFNDKSAPDAAFRIVLLSPTTLERREITAPPSEVWGDHDPTFSGDGSQIAFTRSISEGMQDIYLTTLDGDEVTRLTSDSRNIYGHAFSPDGRYLIYSSNRGGPTGLWRVAIRGGAPSLVAVGDGQIFFPDISARQHRLAYRSVSQETNIWRVQVGADTLAPTQVAASTQWDLHPQLSPDGQKLAFTSNRSGQYEIWVSEADGANPLKLTAFDGPFTSTPRWSPDSRSLVFTSRPGGQADLFVMGIDDQLPRRLTNDATEEMAASWSHDGQWIYFSSSRSGAWEVWRMPADGNRAQQVTKGGGFGPLPSPDGQHLYYTKPNVQGLWRQSAEGGPEEATLSHLDPRDWGSWQVTPEGIYYVNRGRPTVLARHSFETGRADTLFTPPNGIPSMDPAFTVSADGQWLFYGQVDRSESDLMLVENFQ